jgi:hypothetical protein
MVRIWFTKWGLETRPENEYAWTLELWERSRSNQGHRLIHRVHILSINIVRFPTFFAKFANRLNFSNSFKKLIHVSHKFWSARPESSSTSSSVSSGIWSKILIDWITRTDHWSIRCQTAVEKPWNRESFSRLFSELYNPGIVMHIPSEVQSLPAHRCWNLFKVRYSPWFSEWEHWHGESVEFPTFLGRSLLLHRVSFFMEHSICNHLFVSNPGRYRWLDSVTSSPLCTPQSSATANCKLELQTLAHFTAHRKRLTSSQKNSFVSRMSGLLTGNFASHLTIKIVDRSIWSAIWARKPNASRCQVCLQVNGESLNRHWKEVHCLHHLTDPANLTEEPVILQEIEMESAE